MKLKRMWPSVCVWIVFIIFDVIMVASSGYFSGLFPSANIIPYVCAMTIAGVLLMGVFTFLLGKLADSINIEEISKGLFCTIIFWLMLITILVGGVVIRNEALSTTTNAPSGKLSLYENAMVGAGKVSEYDLLSIVYSKILNVVLLFTGNRVTFAFYFQVALIVLFVLVGAIAIKVLLGRGAALVFAFYTSFMPVFMDSFKAATISTDELFIFMYGVELLLIAIYLKMASDGKFKSAVSIIYFVILGAAVGFMTYVDAGTIIVVAPLLLSGLFLKKSDPGQGFLRLLVIAISGFAVFFGMILQEGGFENFELVLSTWSKFFFKNINTFNTFWTYTNYKIEYLITFILMSGVIVGYWKNRYFERITPWLLSTMIIFFATPFFGATRMNSQVVLTIYFGIVLGCVVSLITLSAENTGSEAVDAVSDSLAAIKENETEPQEVQAEKEAGIQIVKPEADKLKDSYYYKNMSRDEEETSDEDEIATDEVIEDNTQSADETHIDNTDTEQDTDKNRDDGFLDDYDEYEEDSEEDYEEDSEEDSEEYSAVETEEKEEPVPVVTVSNDASLVDSAQIENTGNAFASYANRYVPEGMVLPEGSEEEMDLSNSKMKMPKFEGKIGLGRNLKTDDSKAEGDTKAKSVWKEEKLKSADKASKVQSKSTYKDDFDIAFKPGDDFDF